MVIKKYNKNSIDALIKNDLTQLKKLKIFNNGICKILKIVNFKFNLILIGILIQSSAFSQNSKYYWYNGDSKIYLDIIPNRIVEFGFQDSEEQKNKTKLNSEKVTPKPDKLNSLLKNPLWSKNLSGGHRFLKINQTQFNQVLNLSADSNLKVSPLFKEGSDIKALAGGVIIHFKRGVSEKSILDFCKKQNLTIERKLTLVNEPIQILLIKSDSGIKSLDLANQLIENYSEVVDKAQPNFWRPLNSKEIRGYF